MLLLIIKDLIIYTLKIVLIFILTSFLFFSLKFNLHFQECYFRKLQNFKTPNFFFFFFFMLPVLIFKEDVSGLSGVV